jgi:hypothetical protein
MATLSSGAILLLRRGLATAAKQAEEVVRKRPGTGNPKKKNVFDLARLLPDWGVGHKVAKTHWKPHTYYKLCDVKLRKVRMLLNLSELGVAVRLLITYFAGLACQCCQLCCLFHVIKMLNVFEGDLEFIFLTECRPWNCMGDISRRR